MRRTFVGISIDDAVETTAKNVAIKMENIFPDRVVECFETNGTLQIGVEVLKDSTELMAFVSETRDLADAIEDEFEGKTAVIFQIEE